MQAESRKKILVFIDWYLPGFRAGGPIRSCANLVSRMESHFHFKIITGDTDLGASQPYAGIKSNDWNKLGGGEEVFYCKRTFLSHTSLDALVRKESPDVIYLNSLFSQWYTLVPLIIAKRYGKAKVVVAPRGMLSPGALSIKPAKKKLFLTFAKTMRLFRNVTWHASTEVEVAEIRSVFGSGAHVIHAMNLTPLRNKMRTERKKTPGTVNLVYIGRISEVKNPLQAIESLALLPSDKKVSFDLYGPADNAEYLQRCEAAIDKLPDNITARLMGPVENDKVPELLSRAHFFYMLTFNENFGHAIVEAFSAGCPVIISNCTPWKQLEARKCGWDLNLSKPDAIQKALSAACQMDQQQYDEWSEAATAFGESVTKNDLHVTNTIKLFS
ncbi:MAG TPA: glycosyltransferase family 4 protein [Bacteroidia bacterium]|nr:glycosyltransferase family 4 protein [Bacteroidia bacterium]